jgi:accessory colonization factor AcfC
MKSMVWVFCAVIAVLAVGAGAARAAEPLHVYGPGGPLPAMREAAAVFGKAHGVDVIVTAGPTPKWLDAARRNADLVFSGSEAMMSDFIAMLKHEIDPATVRPLYLRPSAILVRPGNPEHITGIADLLKPGHHILVVNGAGQQGLWEDVAGRLGNIGSVAAFRANIAYVATNSAEARKVWIKDRSLDAWLIWTIWQVANPTLAQQVPVEPAYRIFRDTGIAITYRGEKRKLARQFAAFLASPAGEKIFVRWGWTPRSGR